MTMQVPGKRGRGRPPKKIEPPEEPSKVTVSVGNCRVEFPTSLTSTSDAEGLCIKISDTCAIGIKVAKESPILLAGLSFTLLNPKSLDGVGKQLLQNVLTLYGQELPAMKYAANTGKESRFLENCVSGGKYYTLILRNAELELIGAMTYQILPADTNQAELPLAAVAHSHHRKGFGAYLYKELQRRLFHVGVLSIFCWGDQESEVFWAKQGFVIVAEVDGRGKPWKLPIKADVRRAMSIPGSATLMISYLSAPPIQPASPGPRTLPVMSDKLPLGDFSGNISLGISKTALKQCPPSLNTRRTNEEKVGQKLSPASIPTPQVGGESKSSHINSVTPGQTVGESAAREQSFRPSITPLNMEVMFTTVASEDPKVNVSKPLERPAASVEIIRPPLVDTTNTGSAPIAVNKPLKKRPLPKSTSKRSNVPTEDITILDGDKENVAEKDLKADNARPPAGLETSFSSPTRRIGRRRRGEPEVPASAVSEEVEIAVALDKKKEVKEASKSGIDPESIPVISSEERIGGKRERGSEAQMSVFTRRSTRRRMADSAEGTEDRENNEAKGSKNDQVDDGAKEMFDLLLSQKVTDVGIRTAVPAAKCGTIDETGAERGTDRIESITNSFDRPNPQIDVERQKPLTKDAEANDGSASSPGHHESRHVEFGGSEGPQKLPSKEINSCGAVEQPLNKTTHVIMFMNMADENKKKQLIKYVEKLSGTVTSDGCKCTHVVTGEVRRTLNFCVAISSGAWILSPEWLKASVKQKRFADEARFVLRERKFEAKYKVKLEDVIRRAKERPNQLLHGMYIYLTPHIHPPVDTISQIVEAAGGKVLGSLEDALRLEDKSHAAAVATEEDMSDAICAAKAGLRTFSSDWLLTCIVKQELDLTATQFSESL